MDGCLVIPAIQKLRDPLCVGTGVSTLTEEVRGPPEIPFLVYHSLRKSLSGLEVAQRVGLAGR